MTQKCSGLKQEAFYLTIFAERRPKDGVVGQVWLRVSGEVEWRCEPALQLPEGLTGVGGLASRLTPSHTWTAALVVSWRTSTLSHGPLHRTSWTFSLHDGLLSPREWSQRVQSLLCYSLEITHHCFIRFPEHTVHHCVQRERNKSPYELKFTWCVFSFQILIQRHQS